MTYNGSRVLGNSFVEGFELEVLIAHELVLVGSERRRHGSVCFRVSPSGSCESRDGKMWIGDVA